MPGLICFHLSSDDIPVPRPFNLDVIFLINLRFSKTFSTKNCQNWLTVWFKSDKAHVYRCILSVSLIIYNSEYCYLDLDWTFPKNLLHRVLEIVFLGLQISKNLCGWGDKPPTRLSHLQRDHILKPKHLASAPPLTHCLEKV